PRATSSPPTSTSILLTSLASRKEAITSTAYPLAIALRSKYTPGSVFQTAVSLKDILSKPTKGKRLLISTLSWELGPVGPKPQAFTTGPTVGSKAPPDS